MTHKEFIKALTKEKLLAVEISRKKNMDYADSQDPFANFKESRDFGISVEQAIMVRMSDKWKRLKRGIRGEKLHVSDETFLDTCRDLANYADILSVWIQCGKDTSLRKNKK
jgi:hypothetical protein